VSIDWLNQASWAADNPPLLNQAAALDPSNNPDGNVTNKLAYKQTMREILCASTSSQRAAAGRHI